jgi:hypothetical protein
MDSRPRAIWARLAALVAPTVNPVLARRPSGEFTTYFVCALPIQARATMRRRRRQRQRQRSNHVFPGTHTLTGGRMGELEPWIDENFVRSIWYNMGETVNVKMIRDKFSG